ncbi:GntR family transcriptional regulator [Acrocarpospora catenulata]|uniref:GntR family transcriptional regulator n=1 Tax=Acrocarpospora catenulata TaxID=2836182 RepID=UPI001BDB319E|nr:winged helix-turn-helix domain-containing protein [Acrocarpospora catenulata]
MSQVPPYDPDEPGVVNYVYMRLADHITARIQAGELLTGNRLPGERDLAEEYGVALGTVRRAVEELRQRGLVITLPAKGTYITDRKRLQLANNQKEPVNLESKRERN